MACSCMPIGVVLQLLAQIPLILYCILKSLVLLFVPKKFQYKKDLTGQTVLITGAGSGIGRLLAIEFSKHSTRLVLLDLNRSALLDTEKLLQPNTSSFVYECDVSDRRKVYEVADMVKRDVGKVDILVNNAGIVSGKRLLDIPDEKIQKTLEVNTLAHFWTCKAFLPAMVEENKGHIVSIASLAGLFGMTNLTDYCASKYAAVGFMQSLFCEVEAQRLDGIKLTTICPTVISTGLFSGMKPPFGVCLRPEDVAQEIMQAVIEEKEIVLIPGWTGTLLLTFMLLPIEVIKSFGRKTGMLSSMDEFTGRETAVKR